MSTTSIKNLKRAEAARMALLAHMHAKGLRVEVSHQPLFETFIDLLADLRHLSAALEIEFSEASRISLYHYDDEST